LRFVGAHKTKSAEAGPRTNRKVLKANPDELYTHIKEYEEWANPSFNVLIVQLPRPGFFENPLIKAFRKTVDETVDLLQPFFRFGIPHTSVRNKCPHWREDSSPVPTTPNTKLQKMLRWMEKPDAGAHAVSKHGHGHDHGHMHGHAHGHGHSLVPPVTFAMHEMPPWVVVAMNVFCWVVLSTPKKSRGM